MLTSQRVEEFVNSCRGQIEGDVRADPGGVHACQRCGGVSGHWWPLGSLWCQVRSWSSFSFVLPEIGVAAVVHSSNSQAGLMTVVQVDREREEVFREQPPIDLRLGG